MNTARREARIARGTRRVLAIAAISVALTGATACFEAARPTRAAHVEPRHEGVHVLLLQVRFHGDTGDEEGRFGSVMRKALARSLHSAGYEVESQPEAPLSRHWPLSWRRDS